MQKSRIKFTKTGDDMVYNPEKKLDTYYQICQFKNPFTKKYGTRKIVFNEMGKILKIYENEYSKQRLDEFIKHHRPNKYKVYPACKIDVVGLPNGGDIVRAQSELLNTDYREYGNQHVDF